MSLPTTEVAPKHSEVQHYYSEVVQTKEDLKTNACNMQAGCVSKLARNAIGNVHDHIIERYYGCGLPFPETVADTRILDLGCGTGRDVYVLSQLTGPTGKVIGVDMTPSQLAVANEFKQWHMDKFGYKEANVEFHEGNIEELSKVPIEKNSIDVVVSNCVVNLARDKRAVLQGTYDLMAEGGEMYFSDIYSSRPVPDDLRKDIVAWGECLSGALYWKEALELAKSVGFSEPVLVSAKEVDVKDDKIVAAIEASAPGMEFVSITYRFFKLPKEAAGEEAISASYQGTIEGFPDELKLGHRLTFKTKEPRAVKGELAACLKHTRYAKHFKFTGCCDSVKQIDVVQPMCMMTKNPKSTAARCC